MSILKIRRIYLHPFAAVMVLRRALHAYTSGELSRESRRRMAGILKVVEDKLDPDEGRYANPYARFSTYVLSKQKERNAELEAEFGDDAKFQDDYAALPNPMLRVSFDFLPEDLKVVESAVESLAKRSEVGRDLDPAFLATFDAIDQAETVEVDTDPKS